MSKLQISLKNKRLEKFLLFSLLASGGALVIANILGKAIATQVSLSLYVISTASLVVLSAIISKRFGIKGSHGKAWLLFAIFASLWFIAERVIMYYNLTTNSEPFPSLADFFWIAGYPFLFIFLLLYLRPIHKVISKKQVIIASLISVSVLIPSMYIANAGNSGSISSLEILVGMSYPVGDAIILIPAIIGMISFFRGEVNFLWILISMAILIEVAGDTGFLLATFNNSYYEGHPVDILFNLSYIMLSFGVYSHLKIFKNRIDMPFKNMENMR